MQTSSPPVTSPADAHKTPLHDDIAQCARDLWVQYGRPTGRDLAIWLEAEQRLQAATQVSRQRNPGSAAPLRPWSANPVRATIRIGAPVLRAAPLPTRLRATPVL